MGRKSRAKWERRRKQALELAEAAVARVHRRQAVERAEAAGQRRGCLVCRRSDGGFKSREHIFPEGLGNKDEVLPNGVVCDRCNNQVLSRLDAALSDFMPIAMMRTINGIPSKAGKLPQFKFDNGALRCVAPGELELNLASKKWTSDVPAPAGHVGLKFSAKRRDLTPKRLERVHRALVKMALEYAWLDLGAERALTDEFDRERDIVLNGGHNGYLVVANTATPDPDISLTYEPRRRASDGHPLVAIFAVFWGVPIFTDTLFSAPVNQAPEGWSVLTF